MLDNFIPDGCILLARKIQGSEIWRKPADWLKVWVYILQEVSHGKSRQFPRGSSFFNAKEMAKECGVTKDTIHNFLKWAKSTTLITTRKTTRGVVITVLQYAKYQDLSNYKSHTQNHTSNDTETTQKPHRNHTITKNVRIKECNNNVVFDKSLLRWLQQNGKTEKYAYWLLSEVGNIETIRAAWSKVLAGRKVNAPSEFVEFCKTLIAA